MRLLAPGSAQLRADLPELQQREEWLHMEDEPDAPRPSLNASQAREGSPTGGAARDGASRRL
jgi:hypothetical protein